MSSKQKKLIEHWLVLGLLIVIFIISQHVDWNTQLALLPFSIYVVFNWVHIDEFQRRSLNPGEIIEQSSGIRLWVYGSCMFSVAVALVFLLSGLNILDYLGFGLLLLLVVLPLLPVVIVSQIALYSDLANEL